MLGGALRPPGGIAGRALKFSPHIGERLTEATVPLLTEPDQFQQRTGQNFMPRTVPELCRNLRYRMPDAAARSGTVRCIDPLIYRAPRHRALEIWRVDTGR